MMAYKYDYTRSYESNFQNWWRLSNYQNKDFRQANRLRWTQEMGREIYDKHYGHKKIKVRRIRTY